MPIVEIESFAQNLPAGRPILALDLGTRSIGIALSDRTRRIASPLTTLARRKFTRDAQRLFDLADEHKAAALVLGLPVNMDGSEGPRAQSTRQFAANLLAIRDIDILLWDERWSTAAVDRMMIEADTSRKRRAELDDKLAAAFFLQSALDRLAALGG